MKLQRAALLAAFALSSAVTTGAHPDDKFPSFQAPAFVGQPNSTTQEWFHFITGSTTGPNAPLLPYTNPNGIPNAYDATAATDGAFLTGGGNIYSPTGAIRATIVIPNYNLGNNWTTQIILQTQTLGSAIDLANVTVTPLGGSPIAAVPADITILSQTPLGGMGGTLDDYKFVWNVPGNAASYTLTFTTPTSSLSWAGARVDTLATPLAAVPEPATLGLAGAAVLGLLLRRRKRQ